MKEQDLREKIEAVERKEISSTKLINKCVQITLDYAREEAIDFAEWLIQFDSGSKTRAELYEIYLTTKTQNK